MRTWRKCGKWRKRGKLGEIDKLINVTEFALSRKAGWWHEEGEEKEDQGKEFHPS